MENTSDTENTEGLPDFIMSESARILLRSTEDILADLVNWNEMIPSDDEFFQAWRRVLDLYDRYQQEVLKVSGITIVCSPGCSTCCFHWVEDVSSFEAMIISRYLLHHYPDSVETVIESFRNDEEALDSLKSLVDEKIAEYRGSGEDLPDHYELLLSCFYQLERPCALLDEKGRCMIYPVRPLTCRNYLNLRDRNVCLPDRINTEEPATFILDISDIASARIEILHRRFERENDTSLRRQMLILLEENRQLNTNSN